MSYIEEDRVFDRQYGNVIAFIDGNNNRIFNRQMGDVIAFIDNDNNRIFNRQYGDIIAFIDGNRIFNRQYGDELGTISDAKSSFPYRDDYVAVALFVLAKTGTIQAS